MEHNKTKCPNCERCITDLRKDNERLRKDLRDRTNWNVELQRYTDKLEKRDEHLYKALSDFRETILDFLDPLGKTGSAEELLSACSRAEQALKNPKIGGPKMPIPTFQNRKVFKLISKLTIYADLSFIKEEIPIEIEYSYYSGESYPINPTTLSPPDEEEIEILSVTPSCFYDVMMAYQPSLNDIIREDATEKHEESYV